jgi:hypothetical protein
MRTIPPEELRRLRNDVPVAAVVDELGLATARRGARRTFQCPKCSTFHTNVNQRANVAHCFRCSRSYNPIDLVIATRGSIFLDAVRCVAAIGAVTPSSVSRPSHGPHHGTERRGKSLRPARD